jgi:hypothetical protein
MGEKYCLILRVPGAGHRVPGNRGQWGRLWGKRLYIHYTAEVPSQEQPQARFPAAVFLVFFDGIYGNKRDP